VTAYTQLLTKAKAAYHASFWDAKSQSYGEAQTGNALAIAAVRYPKHPGDFLHSCLVGLCLDKAIDIYDSFIETGSGQT